MAEPSKTITTSADKGKMILFEEEVTALSDIRPTHIQKTIEAKVYRKWTAMDVRTKDPSDFCCILLDKQGNAIQANMDLKDKDYFDNLLKLNNAYRISQFGCTPTKKWQQTVSNKTTLTFGRYLSVDPIPNDSFPEHYFEFIAYNQVRSKANTNDPTLTDYIGCIHRISDPLISGDATRTRKTRRIIDIQNLDGINLPFLIWDETAENFDMNEYAKMPKPVVIAVSSTWATTKYGVTCFYYNPNVPETHYILDVYAQFINPTESLEIQSRPCQTDEEEKMRNRYSIQTLLNVNPQHYERARFTTEAMITKVSAEYGWYYRKCASCKKKVHEQTSTCPDHGLQTTLNYGYSFRIIIDDGTAEATITCFSPEAHSFAPDCNELVNAVQNKDNCSLPDELKQFENASYIFQYQFGQKAKPGRPNFKVDTVFKASPQPVLQLPAPEPATSPQQELLDQPFSATPPPTETEAWQPTKDLAEGSDSCSKPTNKTTKRQLFQETQDVQKKPRQGN